MKNNYKFSDLFSGIGGMRFAFESLGSSCVFSSELNHFARKTYNLNFTHSIDHLFNYNILEINTNEIPSHDILLAGFPCQPYSIAGLRKGLKDERGGDIFQMLLEILSSAKPECFLLENVKGIMNHEKGETIKFMLQKLNMCGYEIVEPKILNSMTHANIPQNRDRAFIVGFRDPLKAFNFKFPEKIILKRSIHDCLHQEKVDDVFYYSKKFACYDFLKKEIKSSDTIYQWRRRYVRENNSKVCPTLTANMGSGGHNVPIIKDKFGIRKLTPREVANFQGFPNEKKFKFPPGMSNRHLYHQLGNSVTVPLIKRIAKEIINTLEK